MLKIVPVEFAEACAFVAKHHSHHRPPRRWKFGVAVLDTETGNVCGVAMVGRPLARMLCDGLTLEVLRCCTDRTQHAASKLYAACWRAARALGYERLITYTLAEETGVSVVAAGWRVVGRAGGGTWSRPTRQRMHEENTGQKTLWEIGRAHDNP